MVRPGLGAPMRKGNLAYHRLYLEQLQLRNGKCGYVMQENPLKATGGVVKSAYYYSKSRNYAVWRYRLSLPSMALIAFLARINSN
jgi:hypothetical protein